MDAPLPLLAIPVEVTCSAIFCMFILAVVTACGDILALEGVLNTVGHAGMPRLETDKDWVVHVWCWRLEMLPMLLLGIQQTLRVWPVSTEDGHTVSMDEQEIRSTLRLTVDQWMRKLSQASGAPGGGAGTGVVLSVAAALISMVAGYSTESVAIGKTAEHLRQRNQDLVRESLRLADEDSACSQAFGKAFQRSPGPEREAAIRKAALEAATSSARIGRRATTAVPDLEWLTAHGNPGLVADMVVALGALRAAIAGSGANIRFDLSTLDSHRESSQQGRVDAQLHAAMKEFDDAVEKIDALSSAVETQMGRM